MGDFILRYQGIEQTTGDIVKPIFVGPIDNSNRRHLSSLKSLVHTADESDWLFPFHAIHFHKGKNAALDYFA